MQTLKRGALFVFVAWLALSPLAREARAEAPAAAPSSEAQAEASAHFQRGVELFKEDAFRAALVEFQRAYELAPDYRLLYNIGRVQLKLQDYLSAARSYEEYLRVGGSEIPAERRARTEQALEELRGRVGRIDLTVDRPGVDVLLDDVPVGKTPLSAPILANVGRHFVRVRAPEGATETRVVDVAAGDVAKVEIALGVASDAVVEAASPRPWTLRRKITVVTAAAGSALLIGGAVAGVLAWRANEQFEESLHTRGTDRAGFADRQKALRRRAITADLWLGVGAAAVLTSAGLWLFGSEHPPAPAQVALRARPYLGLGELGVAGTF